MAEYKSPYSGVVVPTDYIPRQAVFEAMYHYQRPLTEREVYDIPAANVREISPVQTNADRIRAMSDEELMEWLVRMHYSYCCPNSGAHDCGATCRACWLDWLKSPVEGTE